MKKCRQQTKFIISLVHIKDNRKSLVFAHAMTTQNWGTSSSYPDYVPPPSGVATAAFLIVRFSVLVVTHNDSAIAIHSLTQTRNPYFPSPPPWNKFALLNYSLPLPTVTQSTMACRNKGSRLELRAYVCAYVYVWGHMDAFFFFWWRSEGLNGVGEENRRRYIPWLTYKWVILYLHLPS